MYDLQPDRRSRRAAFGRVASVAIAFGAFTTTPASGQPVPRWSLDATLGAVGSQTKGIVYEEAILGISADLTFAVRWPNRSLVLALSATGNGPLVGGDVCHVDPRGGCLPWHPVFAFLGPSAGWESGGGRVRLMAGPAYALARWERPAFALQSRVDAAILAVRRLALIGSLRATLVPNYDHASYSVISAGIGLRLRGP